MIPYNGTWIKEMKKKVKYGIGVEYSQLFLADVEIIETIY